MSGRKRRAACWWAAAMFMVRSGGQAAAAPPMPSVQQQLDAAVADGCKRVVIPPGTYIAGESVRLRAVWGPEVIAGHVALVQTEGSRDGLVLD